jgi:hypothetical protein
MPEVRTHSPTGTVAVCAWLWDREETRERLDRGAHGSGDRLCRRTKMAG